MRQIIAMFLIFFIAVAPAGLAGCGGGGSEPPPGGVGDDILDDLPSLGETPPGGPAGGEPADPDADPEPDLDPEAAAAEHQEIRELLRKGLEAGDISYSAVFSTSSGQFSYDFYRRENLSKMVTREGDSQSVSISDGKSTIYYSLPEKIGYRMMEAGDDMGLVPDTEALLNEEIYRFRAVGGETIAGLACQVVETEDEFGALKIWISKTLGLPVKYIGSDSGGWYRLELSNIQTGPPSENIFAVPSDVVLNN
ncbi:MAG: DUF4412 domain-containing protein [Peptococcaceae bacterium]|nr:DUF4412 domain-containing protein [Peptococcaceae bacterium]